MDSQPNSQPSVVDDTIAHQLDAMAIAPKEVEAVEETTTPGKPAASFLTLPIELRTMVYNEFMTPYREVVGCRQTNPKFPGRRPPSGAEGLFRQIHSLLSVSQLVRSELLDAIQVFDCRWRGWMHGRDWDAYCHFILPHLTRLFLSVVHFRLCWQPDSEIRNVLTWLAGHQEPPAHLRLEELIIVYEPARFHQSRAQTAGDYVRRIHSRVTLQLAEEAGFPVNPSLRRIQLFGDYTPKLFEDDDGVPDEAYMDLIRRQTGCSVDHDADPDPILRPPTPLILEYVEEQMPPGDPQQAGEGNASLRPQRATPEDLFRLVMSYDEEIIKYAVNHVKRVSELLGPDFALPDDAEF